MKKWLHVKQVRRTSSVSTETGMVGGGLSCRAPPPWGGGGEGVSARSPVLKCLLLCQVGGGEN